MVLRSIGLACLGVLLTNVAVADRGIVVESYTGARPENAGRLLGPVLEELATRGFAVGYDGVGRKFEGEVSRPGRSPAGMPGDFADAIERGHKAWIDGKFDDAISILSPLIEAAHANAAAVSQDAKLRADVQRGLVDLALAYQRQGDPAGARDAMSERIRAFPEAPLSRAAHGPEAFELYEATKKALGSAGRGTLIVDVADDATQVFVDEQYARNGAVRRTDLFPGVYRVYAALGQREGRTYKVEVRADAEARITIDVGLDSVLHVEPSWTGMSFVSVNERERFEGGYAASFARLAHANAVAVVGVDTVRGRLALVGSLVSLDDGSELRRASLAIDPEPSSDRRRALARFLAGDDAAGAQLDIEDPDARNKNRAAELRLPSDRHHRGSRWGALKYVTTGLGIVAGGVGAYLLVLDGGCASDIRPCPELYDYTVPGWSLAGGGAALLGLGIYMFVTDHPSPERTVTVVPTRGGALASVRLSF